MRILPSDGSYTTFCDIVTGYRLAAVVKQSVDSGIIEIAGENGCGEAEMLSSSGMRDNEGRRFLALLLQLGILEKYGEIYYLSQFSRRYLYSRSELNQLAVLQFEQILIDKWEQLPAVLTNGQGMLAAGQPDPDYLARLNLFQQAMHAAALIRSRELWDTLPAQPESGLIIDLGAGDGSYLKEFLKRYPKWQAVACDLENVVALIDVPAITKHACNLIDPKQQQELLSQYRGSAGIVLISNVMHCYSTAENETILASAAALARPDGLLVVHDFFSAANPFGSLYDAHMMLNTYNGRTYTLDETVSLLSRSGFPETDIIELESYSHVVLASRQTGGLSAGDQLISLRRQALSGGFFECVEIEPAQIPIEAWVKAKCRFGCRYYGRKWSCPPHSMDADEFKELAGCYKRALVVAGQPPLTVFQQNLLELEKHAFMQGFKKALAFTGGPCCWCENCPDERCSFPEKRRPSLESCGCDVFALAESCRIPLKPVRNSDDFIQYIGLLLVE